MVDMRTFLTAQKVHAGDLPNKSPNAAGCVALLAWWRGPGGSADTTGHHLKHHWWYKYYWLRNTFPGCLPACLAISVLLIMFEQTGHLIILHK